MTPLAEVGQTPHITRGQFISSFRTRVDATRVIDQLFNRWLPRLIIISDSVKLIYLTAAVAEWVRAWDTLPMFEATVCGRSWVRSPWGSVNYRPSAPLLYEVASHVKQLPFRPFLLLYLAETSIFLGWIVHAFGRNVHVFSGRNGSWPKRPVTVEYTPSILFRSSGFIEEVADQTGLELFSMHRQLSTLSRVTSSFAKKKRSSNYVIMKKLIYMTNDK